MGIEVPRETLRAEGAVAERLAYVLAVPEPLSSKQFPAMREPGDR